MADTNKLPEPFPTTADDIEAAEWGGRTATVRRKFNDGGMVVSFHDSGGKYEPLRGKVYYVPPGADKTANETWQNWYEIQGRFRIDRQLRRADIIGKLNERTGFWWEVTDTADSSMVPLVVATDGKKALAAYLFGMHHMNINEVAKKLDIAGTTVQQYLSDYKAERTG